MWDDEEEIEDNDAVEDPCTKVYTEPWNTDCGND